MKVKSLLIGEFFVAMAISLTGCQSNPPGHSNDAAVPAAQKAAVAAVDAGGKQFQAGDFQGAIKTLNGNADINAASGDVQIRAHKLLAFSYCSVGKLSFCHAEFVRILQINPAFKLSDSERSHPIWGPEFESARK